MEDFTARDRFIILDLFVNNEKTLLKIYEALFQGAKKSNTDSTNHLRQAYASIAANAVGNHNTQSMVSSEGGGSNSLQTLATTRRGPVAQRNYGQTSSPSRA